MNTAKCERASPRCQFLTCTIELILEQFASRQRCSRGKVEQVALFVLARGRPNIVHLVCVKVRYMSGNIWIGATTRTVYGEFTVDTKSNKTLQFSVCIVIITKKRVRIFIRIWRDYIHYSSIYFLVLYLRFLLFLFSLSRTFEYSHWLSDQLLLYIESTIHIRVSQHISVLTLENEFSRVLQKANITLAQSWLVLFILVAPPLTIFVIVNAR